MKAILTVLILVFVVNENSYGIATDSVIKYSDLKFKNELEKLAFSKYTHSKNNDEIIIDLFLTPYDKEKGVSVSDASNKIKECVNYLRKETEGKTDAKKIKLIYNYVHKHFLKVYELNNSFSDIFEKGEYNCVSASALYAIIFSKLNVPYKIMEAPEHVYIIADPETDKILIETTSPDRGYYKFTSSDLQKYVKNMVSSKLIAQQEYDTTSITKLIDKYFFSSDNVSLTQLAGIQYSNFSIYASNNKDYETALTEMKKSYYLYPNEKSKYMLRSTIAYQLDNGNYNDTNQVSKLAILCRFNNQNKGEVSNEMIKNEFLKIIQTQLINSSEYDKFDRSYSVVKSNLTDSTLISEIGFDYHYELARLGYFNLKNSSYVINHLQKAYSFNSKHANLKSIILAYFERELEKNSSPQASLSLIESYASKFGFVSDDKYFNDIKANCILEEAYELFVYGDIKNGELFLKKFEFLCSEKTDTEPKAIFVEKAYAQAAGLYYKKGNYAKAKQMLNTGLNYAPDSFPLLIRLGQIN